MAIKSKKQVLLWERNGNESLSATVLRLPVQIAAYEEEEQGESIAWKDASTFYTTSDSQSDTPIYQYTRSIETTAVDPLTANPSPLTVKALIDGQLYIIRGEHKYSAQGQILR